MTALRYLAVATLGVLVGWLATKPVTVNVPVAVDAPQVRLPQIPPELFAFAQPAPVAAVAPPVVEGRERLRPAQRLFAKLIRHRAAEHLQRDGFALVGGSKTPLTAAQAAALLAHLDDAEIVAAATGAGAAEGGALDRVGTLLDWITAHKEEILKVVELVLRLLMLFADGPQ